MSTSRKWPIPVVTLCVMGEGNEIGVEVREIEKKLVVSVWGGKRKFTFLPRKGSLVPQPRPLSSDMHGLSTRLVGQCALSVL